MIDDLEQLVEWNREKYIKEREGATEAALNLCPAWVREWLVGCTAGDNGEPYSHASSYDDDVEWFPVGHNASHYFSFGVRSDGVFIQKIEGDEYDEDCQCWGFKTTLRIVTLEQIPQGYWGHS